MLQILFFLKKHHFKKKIETIACNLKGCLDLYVFMFLILPNLAKHTYEPSPMEQHHTFQGKKHWSSHVSKYAT